ncbi:MAG: hypothetical protein ABR613_12780 [Actinomycetota bacterium]
MKSDGRGRSASWIVVGVAALAAALAPSPAPASVHDTDPPAAQRVRLPRSAEVFLQQQQFDTADLMFAQLVRPRYKGYAWSVTAFKQNPSARTNLSISFARSAAEETQIQTSAFGWTLPKGALRMDRDLKPASLATGKSMGTNGRIAMRLAGSGRFARARNPAGCTGSISFRVGWFRGTFRFHARDRYFRRISFQRTRVVLYRAENLRCGGEPASTWCPDHLWLAAVEPESGVAVEAFKTEEGKVDQRVVVAGSSGDARTTHHISVETAVPDAFVASDDLTSASVDGDVAGPWLSGDLSYLAPPPPAPGEDPDCGLHRVTSGVVTGDYTAHFDSIGPVAPASTGITATLRREGP